MTITRGSEALPAESDVEVLLREAKRRSRKRRLSLVGAVLLVIAVVVALLVFNAGSGNGRPASTSGGDAGPGSTTPIRIDGLRITRITVSLVLHGRRDGFLSLLRADSADASRIAGLDACAPLPQSMSGMPELPGFSCGATPTFTGSSLSSLQRIGHPESISARYGRLSTSLYFLGVHRGDPALIVEPIGDAQRIRADLSALRGLPGVQRCEWSGTIGFDNTIACSTTSHAAALNDQKAARRLNVAYAEVFLNW